jgi:helicase
MPTDGAPLESLGLDEPILEVLRKEGISALYPPQSEALGPALEGKSVVLACPTASGKSLVAYLALVSAALEGRKGLYVVPLRALASEKYQDLKAFEGLGLKIGLTMGERDISSSELERVDILVATSEKTDSLLRHRSPWVEDVKVVVADEVHLLREPSRGPTLEVTLTRLMRHDPTLQVIALSATVANSRELAAWLKAAHVASSFRPVDLKYGTYFDSRLTFLDGSAKEVASPGDPVERLVRSVIGEGGQALVFVNTRKSSEVLAERLGRVVEGLLSLGEKKRLGELSQKITGSSEEVTGGARKLSQLVLSGTAYHNASLTNSERSLVEKAFKEGLLKALSATPTLAAGVNLPARRVIVRDLARYEERSGMNAPLPVFEVHQMCGRAGRPKYDPYGEAVLIAKTEGEEEDLRARYFLAPPERVESKLASEAVLRTHLLALVASGEVRREKELEEFLEGTFYGQTYAVEEIRRHLLLAQEFLVRHGLLFGGELKATAFGKLASDLYLDPVTAALMRTALRRASSKSTLFSYVATVTSTPDIAPLYLRRDDESAMMERYLTEERTLLIKPGEEVTDMDLDSFLSTLKTAVVLESWMDDSKRLSEITDRYGLGAGDLHSRVERAEWLLSSMAQIARWERRELVTTLDELSIRVRYGVKPELLDLISLRGVGRVRARALFQAGFRTREELRLASEAQVVRALGSSLLARDVLQQVKRHRNPPGSSADPELLHRDPGPRTGQTRL